MQKQNPKSKNLIHLDDGAKCLLNEIKSHLIKQGAKDPSIMGKTSYREITRKAIEEYHKKIIG